MYENYKSNAHADGDAHEHVDGFDERVALLLKNAKRARVAKVSERR